ncbi:MAG TPA: fumarylacetoacetase [Terriglobales bacterium]|nr:fumarylacetoacetase [Terriglobales bacterium]
MTLKLNETHDPQAKSWLKSANLEGAPFPIQNLPFGVYRPAEGPAAGDRIGVAIGDSVFDLQAAAKLLDPVSSEIHSACRSPLLNDLMSLAPEPLSQLRRSLFRLLHESAPPAWQREAQGLLAPQSAVIMKLPCRIGDYTDFYAGIHHAQNVGRLFRPQNPLLPNYKWIPIAYHGRSSSIVISGTPIPRLSGQIKSEDSAAPVFAPTRRLDYELELGFFVGRGNAMGEPIPLDHAEEHIFGVGLLNDWSARDIQAWEYQPLGPFLAKNFATTISPWIVTMEALTPFRCRAFSRFEGDPEPLPYLRSVADSEEGGFDISLEITLSTEQMRMAGTEPVMVCATSSRNLYWTAAQCIAHHASNGCNLRPGDLLGSGTISGENGGELGSLLELTQQGKAPVDMPNGQQRIFLERGDEVTMRGWCRSKGYKPIGLGECRGRITG